MGVDGHGREVEYDGGHDVGGFAAHARQALQEFDVGGYLATEVADQHACKTDEVAAFVVGVGDGVDVAEDVLLRGLGHRLGGGVGGEEGGGDEVDPLVGALGGEDHGDEELEGAAVVELRGGVGHRLLEVGNHLVVALLEGHGRVGSSETRTG